MSDFPAGTVAVATVRGVPNVRVMRRANDGAHGWASTVGINGWWLHGESALTDVRPLVVLDLFSIPCRAETLVRVLREHAEDRHSGWRLLGLVADQIEQQTRPPKPEEPTGLGAVVEDSRGVRFVRTEDGRSGCLNPWSSALHPAVADEIETLPYADIDAVRVLSEGVTNG